MAHGASTGRSMLRAHAIHRSVHDPPWPISGRDGERRTRHGAVAPAATRSTPIGLVMEERRAAGHGDQEDSLPARAATSVAIFGSAATRRATCFSAAITVV